MQLYCICLKNRNLATFRFIAFYCVLLQNTYIYLQLCVFREKALFRVISRKCGLMLTFHEKVLFRPNMDEKCDLLLKQENTLFTEQITKQK